MLRYLMGWMRLVKKQVLGVVISIMPVRTAHSGWSCGKLLLPAPFDLAGSGQDAGDPYVLPPSMQYPRYPAFIGRRLLEVYCAMVTVLYLNSPTLANTSTLTTGFVCHPDYLLHQPGTMRPELPVRLTAVVEHLQAGSLWGILTHIEPESVDDRWLLQLHSADYLRQLDESVTDLDDLGSEFVTLVIYQAGFA